MADGMKSGKPKNLEQLLQRVKQLYDDRELGGYYQQIIKRFAKFKGRPLEEIPLSSFTTTELKRFRYLLRPGLGKKKPE